MSFSTSDPACATVNGAGTVTGVGVGSCTITAASGTWPGSITVNVTP